MKLISLNVEGLKHEEAVFDFLTKEDAEVVCLMEFPEVWLEKLEKMGYFITFAPMCLRSPEQSSMSGIVFASKQPHQADTHYYYRTSDVLTIQRSRVKETIAHPVIIGSVEHNGETYRIATTHMIVTVAGKEDAHQQQGMKKMLSILENYQPHVLCGDFNMPRGFNTLYPLVTQSYTDTVPKTFSSSLDKNLHRLGNNPDLDQPIFDIYMVDYIFTQSPYTASDVTLRFNISDHAAVVGTIDIKNT
jgi:endonuclease/exonuclease/phosphatase family metal-dependent hydrolase